MRRWFDDMARKFQRWMIGRYGTDELSKCLVGVGILLMVVSWFIRINLIYLLSWIFVIIAYVRTFSRNIIKRSREREQYLRLTAKLRSKLSVYKRQWKDRKTHNYYRCPKCKTMIRVPKGKGKIIISCPRCREEITKTT